MFLTSGQEKPDSVPVPRNKCQLRVDTPMSAEEASHKVMTASTEETLCLKLQLKKAELEHGRETSCLDLEKEKFRLEREGRVEMERESSDKYRESLPTE